MTFVKIRNNKLYERNENAAISDFTISREQWDKMKPEHKSRFTVIGEHKAAPRGDVRTFIPDEIKDGSDQVYRESIDKLKGSNTPGTDAAAKS